MAALIQMHLYDFSYDEARGNSFHFYYGHIPNSDGPIETVLRDYKPYAETMSFRDWLTNHYDRNKYKW